MDLAISDGDFVLDGTGRPAAARGIDELFQRALIRLTVPLGAFPCDPKLGSGLHALTADTPLVDEKALSMAKEALRNMPQAAVAGARYCPGDAPRVAVTVSCGSESRELEVKL